MTSKLLRVSGFVIVFALVLEIIFRAGLYLKYPERFAPVRLDSFNVVDRSMWRYDPKFGYDYVPSVTINATSISDGQVTGCSTSTPVNAQGNIGPAVPDFDAADIKIALFGDSFSGFELDGVTWPYLLQDKLEKTLGKKVRVLNLARDGSGVMLMFDAAAAKIPILRPDLVIIAFNSTAITAARTWRVVEGKGDGARLVTTLENSPNPPDGKSTDIQLLMPSATREWCNATLQEHNKDDPVLRRILAKSTLLTRVKLQADIFDLKTSYLFDRLVWRDPFASQWSKLPPGANPELKIADFRLDSQFVKSARAVMGSGIPVLIIHLPMGINLRENREFAHTGNSDALLQSLESITDRPVIRMKPYLELSAGDAMKMCLTPTNCHPSRFGMEVYANAVKKIVLEKAGW